MKGRRWSTATTKLLAGVVVLLLLSFGFSLYGVITSGSRVDTAVSARSRTTPRVNVLVVLTFKPLAFHLKYLQDYGSLGRVNGHTVELRLVTPQGLGALGRTPWISEVKLDPPRTP